MIDDTADGPTASAAPSVPPNSPVKPGWQTTEWWLSTAAIAMSALFASGALTNNTALAIAGMAATVLTALGYKVSRTLVKTAGALLLILTIGATAPACTKQQVASGMSAGGTCQTPSIVAAVGELLGWATDRIAVAIAGGQVDSAKLRAAMANVIDTSPRCAIEAAVAGMARPSESARSLAPPVDGDALLAKYARAKAELGWSVSP